MRGMATYLTDAIAVGYAPDRVAVSVARIPCERSWPSSRSSRPSLRPWQRGEPSYFDFQVDRAAALLPESPLPDGTVASRPLGRDEQATSADSAGSRRGVMRVVLQFIVEKSGRADSTHVKVLSAGDSAHARLVRKRLPDMRFAPAMREGQPVHQLAQWLFELRR